MKKTIVLLIALLTAGCATQSQNINATPIVSKCGINPTTTARLLSIDRGPVNGGFDDNNDGVVDHNEAFTHWDFKQLHSTLNGGKSHHPYKWTNIDTCYKFAVSLSDVYEDDNQHVIWQSCRNIIYKVFNASGASIGHGYSKACRNHGTMKWKIL